MCEAQVWLRSLDRALGGVSRSVPLSREAAVVGLATLVRINPGRRAHRVSLSLCDHRHHEQRFADQLVEGAAIGSDLGGGAQARFAPCCRSVSRRRVGRHRRSCCLAACAGVPVDFLAWLSDGLASSDKGVLGRSRVLGCGIRIHLSARAIIGGSLSQLLSGLCVCVGAYAEATNLA